MPKVARENFLLAYVHLAKTIHLSQTISLIKKASES